ncbi:alkaline phosphatase family protein [Sphingomonas sp. NFR15]|uniref:alkaline phosphatase family protein n=1 Tax=Sphingomonas sp. NFR15 TaxID=1566282 RepID=UPI000883FFDC|nr:alkaline phosphatase family protein [Sphingomonas sp. NFR15]SDA20665.1 Predicted pyrophosphatase or phosphodiesterase, AlkP superfamily [Sphingomonas sp. NFR15]
MNRLTSLIALSLALVAVPLAAQTAPQAPSPETPPKLIVAISVDQFSADLFAEYRNHFTGGFARLLTGDVFPAGYQSHAATETCPGHSTILTGFRPARTGIIANTWYNLKSPLADKVIYCAEDESVPGSTHDAYTVTDQHLLVPTLGERMKAANPASRTVSVAGKDRAAVMMGGHKAALDEIWWWDGKAFVSYAGRKAPEIVTRTNALVNARIAEAQPAFEVPDFCVPHDRAIPIGGGKTVGAGHFEREAGNRAKFRASPEFDNAILALGAGMVREMKLGQGPATDIIDIGASATDYIGHTYGTEGAEMCIQLANLDHSLGELFDQLDQTGVDYLVVLTADHGGHDLPERNREHAAPTAVRIDPAFTTKAVSDSVAAKLKLPGQVLFGDSGSGDLWIDPRLSKPQHDAVLAEALKIYRANPQVAAAFSGAEIAASPEPSGPPETWPLIMRAKASYNPRVSGDIVVALKPRVMPIADPTHGYVATHGSFWDYDRRVPILFWRKGMTGFEQPLSVETVDIVPTLAAAIHLPLSAPLPDGRCLDLDGGVASTCP